VPEPEPLNSNEQVLFGGRYITAELCWVLENRVASGVKNMLPRAGITSLDQVAAMTDEELLALRGVGAKIVAELRAAIARRDPGLALVRDAFGVIVHGIYDLPDDDPYRPALAQAGEILTAALAESVEA
jgi:hypothetical protein